MPRKTKVGWDKRAECWRSDCGPVGSTGRRKPVYFRDLPHNEKGRRQAADLHDQYVRDRDRHEKQQDRLAVDPPAREVVKRYLEHLRSLIDKNERSEATLRSHRERLVKFLAFVGPDGRPMADRPVSSLTDDDGARFLTWCEKQKLGARRREGLLTSLKACFAWAARRIAGRDPKQFIQANPFAELERPEVPKSRRPTIDRRTFGKFIWFAHGRANEWTPIAGNRCSGCVRAGQSRERPCRRSHSLRHRCNRAFLVLLLLQFRKGTRPSELAKATWGPTKQCPEAGWEPRAWQDKNGHWWGLLTVYGKTTRKTGENRQIQVPPRLTREIERIRANPLHPVYIFVRPARTLTRTAPWNAIKLAAWFARWRDEARENKIPIPKDLTVYAMRHRYYSKAVYEAGLTGEQAGAVGGSSGKMVRDVYAHAEKEQLFKAAFRIDEAMRDSD